MFDYRKALAGGLVAVLAGCAWMGQERSGADYTVHGYAHTAFKKKDTRVYIDRVITEDLYTDGIHDPANDAIASLQQPAEAMGHFPADRRGGVNWVKALEDGLIHPRADLKGEGEMLVMDLDILFTDTGDMPYVRFPHLEHTRWLDCSNCHPAIFVPQKGGNPAIGMDAVLSGRYCGVCHGKVAFPMWTCERCHSVPHEGAAAWWRDQDNPQAAKRQRQRRDGTAVDEDF